MKTKHALFLMLVGVLAIVVFEASAEEGTFAEPRVSDVAVYGDDAVTVRRIVFSYQNGMEEVVGTKTGVHFTLNRPVKDVWPVFQNFNLWQNHQGYFFSGAFGDREGDLEFLMGPREKASIDNTQAFTVQQIIPEQVIVLHAPPWELVNADGVRVGNRHEGKHVFMLNEVNGKTVVTAAMEHSYHYYGPEAKTKAEIGLVEKIKISQERQKNGKKDIWETAFVPKLKELLEADY